MMIVKLFIAMALVVSAAEAQDCRYILPGFEWLGRACAVPDVRGGSRVLSSQSPQSPTSSSPATPSGGDDGDGSNGEGKGKGNHGNHDNNGKSKN